MHRMACVIYFFIMLPSITLAEHSLKKNERDGIIGVVEKYAAAIACVGEEPVKDIRTLRPFKGNVYSDSPEYLVVWLGNESCEGGTGTSWFEFSIVRMAPNGEYKVDPEKSSPVISMDFNPRNFKRIVSNTENMIVVESSEYAKGDANCCPSLSFRSTLKYDKKGNWRLVSKKRI